MRIDRERCTGCQECVVYCPLSAIVAGPLDTPVEIDQHRCVECGACLRSGACGENALVMPVLAWPRLLRERFSNPRVTHPATRVPGRGTEEMKTNEVTKRFAPGSVGVSVEVGRPGLGASFADVEAVTSALADLGVAFVTGNPVTSLMSDASRGTLLPEILSERVMSALVEVELPLGTLPRVLARLREVAAASETVCTVGITSALAPDGSDPALPLLAASGFRPEPNGKTNLGLGRPRAGGAR